MAGDALTGTQPVGPISPTSGLGATSNALTQRTPVIPIQATILSRPPDLPTGSITSLGGTLGAALPGGEVPLATDFGTVLLRPLPGAWPADLPAGSNINITLGPGVRAGNVEVAGQSLPASTQNNANPGNATRTDAAANTAPVIITKPMDNAAVLRGLLAGADAGSPQQPVIPTLRAGSAAVLAAGTAGQPMPTAQQTASTSAASAPLLSSAGSSQPRPVAAAVTNPATTTVDAPRTAGTVQTAQAVPDVAADTGAATQDLLRHAALQTPVAGSGKAAGKADMAAIAEDLAPDTAKSATAAPPRPDQTLAAALAQPGMMARMAAFMPRADKLGGLALMLYLFGARNGGVRAWLGEDQLRHVTKGEAAALAELEEAMVPTTRLASDGGAWTSVLVPFMDGDQPSVVLLASMGGLVVPVERDPRDHRQEDEDADETEMLPASAFTLGADLSALGPVQLRGVCMPGRLLLDLTVAALPDLPAREAFEEMAGRSLREIEPGSVLRLHWGQPPHMPDLMPGGNRPGVERRV
jgi:hypothetical protein